jgi:hypothetical protein
MMKARQSRHHDTDTLIARLLGTRDALSFPNCSISEFSKWKNSANIKAHCDRCLGGCLFPPRKMKTLANVSIQL